MIIALCICSIFLLLDRKQAEYIRSLLQYQKQLTLSNEKAILANRTKSVFLSHMSHDIRTPMNGIMGMVERIRRNKDDPQIIDDCLNKIDVTSGHLLSLLNDILDMSALEQNEVKLENKAFDLSAELQNVYLLLNEQANEKNVTLEIHTEALAHTRLIGSPLHLRRILLNLGSNSLKYNKPNGRVDIYVQELNESGEHLDCRFIVQDTGIGMSQEFLHNCLYKPFTQENDNVRTKYQGTGLGMSIVNGLVKTMGATIQVDSTQGVGTVFTVQLPFTIDTKNGSSVSSQQQPADISGMRVLVVEDNELNREIAQSMLEDAGVEVPTAENGKAAVELFSASAVNTYDAILMDIMMPIMDGIQATRKIRSLSRPDAAAIPIIAMTANAFAEDRQKSLDAGMSAHLTKPIDLVQLCKLLADYKKRK